MSVLSTYECVGGMNEVTHQKNLELYKMISDTKKDRLWWDANKMMSCHGSFLLKYGCCGGGEVGSCAGDKQERRQGQDQVYNLPRPEEG